MHLGAALAAFAALWGVVGGDVGMGAAIVVFMLSREVFRPVQDLSQAWHAGYLGLTTVDGVDRLLSLTPVEHGEHAEPARSGSVIVRGLAYAYPGSESGLHGVDLELKAEEVLAVVGPSGSGKSTLARVLERDVDPDRGSVLVDGVPLREFTPEARTRSIVVVPQDPVLLGGACATTCGFTAPRRAMPKSRPRREPPRSTRSSLHLTAGTARCSAKTANNSPVGSGRGSRWRERSYRPRPCSF